jgi:ribosomal protein L14
MRKNLGFLNKLCDNTGVLTVKCISLKNVPKLTIGAFLLVVIKKKKKLKKLLKKKILNAILLQIKKKHYRKRGDYYFQFFAQRVALVNQDYDNFLGTRVYSPLIYELFFKKINPLEALLKYFRFVI